MFHQCDDHMRLLEVISRITTLTRVVAGAIPSSFDAQPSNDPWVSDQLQPAVSLQRPPKESIVEYLKVLLDILNSIRVPKIPSSLALEFGNRSSLADREFAPVMTSSWRDVLCT